MHALIPRNIFKWIKTNQCKRHPSKFFNALKEFDKESKVLGSNVEELGSYSARKDAASVVAYGCAIPLLILSSCGRARLSMGAAKEYY